MLVPHAIAPPLPALSKGPPVVSAQGAGAPSASEPLQGEFPVGVESEPFGQAHTDPRWRPDTASPPGPLPRTASTPPPCIPSAAKQMELATHATPFLSSPSWPAMVPLPGMPYHSQARPSSLPPAPSPAGGASSGCLHRSMLLILRAVGMCKSSLCPAPGTAQQTVFSFFLTEGCCLTEFCCFPPTNCPVISLMLLMLLVPPTALMKHLGVTAVCEAFNSVIFSLQRCGCCCVVTKSCPTLATPGNVARQVPLSLGFCRQEYWSR